MRRSPVIVSSASVVLAAALLLSGCQAPDPEPTGSATPSRSATPTETPAPTSTPPASAIPVDIACDALVTPQAMYDFNPNFSLLASWTPDAGTPAAEAVAAQGVACRWKNDTSGESIDISVAAFDAATLDAKASATYADSTMVPTYGGDEGYFSVTGGVGEAVVFSGQYWVVARSVAFLEPGDAEPIMSAALSALG